MRPSFASKGERRRIDVLLIEDDDTDACIFEKIASMVSEIEVRITHIRDIADAKEVLKKQRFDICFLDFWLGDDSALRLIDKFESEHKNMKTVILSNISAIDVEKLRLTAGDAHYIPKIECTAETLGAALNTALDSAEKNARLNIYRERAVQAAPLARLAS